MSASAACYDFIHILVEFFIVIQFGRNWLKYIYRGTFDLLFMLSSLFISLFSKIPRSVSSSLKQHQFKHDVEPGVMIML